MSDGVIQLPVVLMRGGTSKAVFLEEDVIPADPRRRDALLLALMGSPDARQIDGLGGGDAPTSKVAIIGLCTHGDGDVDYTFVQVSCQEAVLDYTGNCGNISSAVGPFAIEQGLVRPREPTTAVRIHNTNTDAVIVAEVPTVGGRPAVDGDFAIAGVPGSGARIALDYSLSVASVTGRLLPTGGPSCRLATEAYGDVTVSVVDCANVVVYVAAEEVGLAGTEGARDYSQRDLDGLEEIRGRIAAQLGMCASWQDAVHGAAMFPLITVVSPPADYRSSITGESIEAGEMDLCVRMQVLRRLHPAYAGTGMANTAMAAQVEGTVVHAVARSEGRPPGLVRLGHPSGVAHVNATVDRSKDGWVAERLSYERTARRLLTGTASVRESSVEELYTRLG